MARKTLPRNSLRKSFERGQVEIHHPVLENHCSTFPRSIKEKGLNSEDSLLKKFESISQREDTTTTNGAGIRKQLSFFSSCRSPTEKKVKDKLEAQQTHTYCSIQEWSKNSNSEEKKYGQSEGCDGTLREHQQVDVPSAETLLSKQTASVDHIYEEISELTTLSLASASNRSSKREVSPFETSEQDGVNNTEDHNYTEISEMIPSTKCNSQKHAEVRHKPKISRKPLNLFKQSSKKPLCSTGASNAHQKPLNTKTQKQHKPNTTSLPQTDHLGKSESNTSLQQKPKVPPKSINITVAAAAYPTRRRHTHSSFQQSTMVSSCHSDHPSAQQGFFKPRRRAPSPPKIPEASEYTKLVQQNQPSEYIDLHSIKPNVVRKPRRPPPKPPIQMIYAKIGQLDEASVYAQPNAPVRQTKSEHSTSSKQKRCIVQQKKNVSERKVSGTQLQSTRSCDRQKIKLGSIPINIEQQKHAEVQIKGMARDESDYMKIGSIDPPSLYESIQSKETNASGSKSPQTSVRTKAYQSSMCIDL